MLTRLLRTSLRPYRGPIVIVLVMQLVQAIANLFLPSLNAQIIDDGVAQGDTGEILRLGAVMLGATTVQIVCAVVAVYYGAQVAMRVGRDLRAEVFGHVTGFSAKEMGTFGAPSLLTRTTNDVQQIQLVVLLSLVMMVVAPMMMVGGVVMALREDAALSLILLVVVPVMAALLAWAVRRMHPLFRSMQGRIDAINRILREQLTGIRVVRAFVRDDHERERFDVANVDLQQVAVGVGRTMALMFPSVMLVMNLTSIAVLWFGGQRIADGQMQVGALTAFLSYIMMILMSVLMAVMMFMIVPRAQVSAERITEVLDSRSTVLPPAAPVSVPARGHVVIEDLEFRYPGAAAPVLHGIDLVATPGTTTAIIGATGTGKTTLLRTIPRLIDATGGRVLVDGVDVRERDPEDLWAGIGYVPQRPYLFAGTVATNLRDGRADATDEELWDALEVAQAADFVRDLGGLDAPVSQGGTNVSGGQRQRLAIARAVVRRPAVYLFDDSFSALDYATDAALRAALAPRTREAAVVVVAQRVATIRSAERIVVIDEGTVVGTGTHEELMAGCEPYREIVLSQLSAEEAA